MRLSTGSVYPRLFARKRQEAISGSPRTKACFVFICNGKSHSVERSSQGVSFDAYRPMHSLTHKTVCSITSHKSVFRY